MSEFELWGSHTLEVQGRSGTIGPKNHSFRCCGWGDEIVLDFPPTFTYHSQTFATGLTADADEMFHD
jgi:hypothetical protein